jgi:hypothetical protein
MSIYDQDTDPSSPDARRQTPEPVAPSEKGGPRTQPSPRAATTDPGVGPPSPPSGARPMGVVVPPASGRGTPVSAPPAGRVKDSVELLLEGMGGPRPDRTKTMPQTAGEGSAAYHAEHAVHAGRTPYDEKKKVLVDTLRLRTVTEGATDAERGDAPVRPPADPTFVLPQRLGPRVIVATIAGLLVVLAIFAYLDRGPKQSVASAPPTAPPTATTPAPAPEAPALPVAALPATSPASEEVTPPIADPSAAPPAAVATRPHGPGPRHKGMGDVGEFKTTF